MGKFGFEILRLLSFHLFGISTKIWEQTQGTEYARGFGAAAASAVAGGTPKVLYTMGKSRDQLYSLVESIGEGTSGLSQSGTMQSSISKSSFVFFCIHRKSFFFSIYFSYA